MFKKWAKATAIRVIKTFAEALSAILLTSTFLYEVDWKLALSASTLASILCLLTCVKGLPEVDGGKHSV